MDSTSSDEEVSMPYTRIMKDVSASFLEKENVETNNELNPNENRKSVSPETSAAFSGDKSAKNLSDICNTFKMAYSKIEASGSKLKKDIEDYEKFISQPSTSRENPEHMGMAYSETKVEDMEPACRLREKGGGKGKEEDSAGEKESNDTKQRGDGNHSNIPLFPGYVPMDAPFNFIQPEKKTYNSSDEYFSDLRLWLQQAYFWQSVTAAFPYFLMCQQLAQTNNSTHQQIPTGFSFPPQFPFPFPQFQANQDTSSQSQQPPQRREIIDGYECRIPSFWKRIVAEFIDFLILFFVKIAVTYIAVDFFHLVDLDNFDIFQKDSKAAYKTFVQITQDIVILEMIHRVVVCAFETFWLQGGQNGRVGGATPGKSIMGLRVIHCESSTPVRESEEVVVVRPGTNIGLTSALFRALTKNFVLALLIPTSFAFIFFPHNRTGYDMICNTIVVEDPLIPHRVHQD